MIFKLKPVKVFGKEEPQFEVEPSPENFESIRKYVQERLLASEVIPEEEANPINPYGIAAHIVDSAWRQMHLWTETLDYVDELIQREIKYPPPPISHNRFSLRAFIKETES